jgi:AraC-like DNA-binding protein
VARTDKRNITKYWWDRHIPGLSLMRADFSSHDYAPHTHDAFVIAVTEMGAAQVKSRGIITAAHAAQLFVSNPEEPQSSWMGASPRWRYRSLYLTAAAIDAVAQGFGIEAVPYFTSNMLADPALVGEFAALHGALEAGNDQFQEHELLIGAFGSLFLRHGSGGGRIEPAPSDRILARKVIEMMQARLGERLLLEELAVAVGLTVFQLIGLFKRTIGTSPHVYLTHQRLNAACRHLRRGVPIAESAAAAGFCDQSALTRHFKRCYGTTPLQFVHAAAVARNPRPHSRASRNAAIPANTRGARAFKS